MGKYEDILKNAGDSVEIERTPTPTVTASVEAPDAPKTDDQGADASMSTLGVELLYKPFGLEATEVTDKEKDKLLFIRKVLDVTSEDAEAKLNNVEKRIGSPRMGVSRVDHVYNYLKVLSQAKKLENKLKALEVGASTPVEVKDAE